MTSNQQDLQALHQILLDILNPNNDIRKKAETNLNSLYENKPILISYLIQILLLSPTKGVKNLSCLLLNKIISIKNNPNTVSLWKEVSTLHGEQGKEEIKSNIIKALLQEKDGFIKKKICDLISNLSETVFENEEKWEDVKILLVNWINLDVSEGNLPDIEANVYLLTQLYAILSEELEEFIDKILSSFEKYFQTSVLSLKTKTGEAIVGMMYVFDKKQKKKLKPFLFEILKTTYECLGNPKEEENLKRNIMTISDIIEVMPGLLKANFSDLFILMGKVSENKDIIEGNIREMGFEIIVSLVEKKKSLFLKDEDRLKVFLQSLFKYSLEMDEEIEAKWLTPESLSYLDEAFVPEEQVEAALSQIDRLIEIVGFDKISKHLTEIILELVLKIDNWKYKYIGFMTISQIIHEVKDISTIENIIEIIISNISNDHPKIRYSCMQCIQQLSENLSPNFQNKYGNMTISLLIERMNDSALRNQLQSCETMQNLIEKCNAEVTFKENSNINLILNAGIQIFLSNTIPLSLRESILNVFCEVGNVGSDYVSSFSEYLLILLNFLSTVYNNDYYKSIYGSLIEVITIFGPKSKEIYIKYIPDIVGALVSIQNRIPKSTDPLFENLKSAWTKIIPLIKEYFPCLIDNIVSSIMVLIVNSPKVYLQNQEKSSVSQGNFNEIDINSLLNEEKDGEFKIEKTKTDNLSTAETSDYAGAIELLNTIIENVGSLFLPYFQKAEEVILPLLSFESNVDIRIESSNTLLEIIQMLSNIVYSSSSLCTVDKNSFFGLSKKYIVILFNSIEREGHNDAITTMLDNMYRIIDLTKEKFLTPDEINELTNKLLNVFEKVERFRLATIEKKKLVDEENKNRPTEEFASDDEEEVEEDDYEDELQNDIDEIEDVLVSIADVFGSIFKTHKELTLGVVNKLKTDLLIKYFHQDSSSFEKKMGLFIIDDMVEYLGQELIPDLWDDIISLLLGYMQVPEDSLRQAASYGLGEVAVNTKSIETFKNKYEILVYNSITASLSKYPKPKNEDLEDDWGYAKDNITVAIAKIIKSQGGNIENISKWIDIYIDNLPIKYDEDESVEQHLLLYDILLHSSLSKVMFGENNKNVSKILLISADIYETKYSNEKVDLLIKEFIRFINGNSAFNDEVSKSKSQAKSKILKKLNGLLQ